MAEQNPRIVVLGSANADISAVTERFPSDGETVSGLSARIGMGGKGTNQATAAARAGADVTIIAKLGSDFLASIPEEHFKKEAIDTRFVTKTDTCGTGCALIEVHAETGENRITVIPGANHAITDADVTAAEAAIAQADLLLTQMETNPTSVECFLKLAATYRKPVVLNPAPALPIPEHWYPLIDTITPNETETERYTGIAVTDDLSAKKAAKWFADRGVKHVIITCGAAGVFCADFTDTAPHAGRVQTNRVRAVDTTGAGDCFNGAYRTAIAEAGARPDFRQMIDACRKACCAATISVTRPGASDSMPNRTEIEEAFRKYYHAAKKIDARAQMIAMENGIFWRALDGTGENGLVTEQDVRRAVRQETSGD